MKIGITGSTGFIGSHLVNNLKNKYEVIGFSRRKGNAHKNIIVDLSKTNEVKDAFSDNEIDILIHTAAIANPNPTPETISQITSANIQSALNISQHYKGNIINFSSVVVYGKFDSRNLIHESNKTNPISLYGITKLAAENIFNIYNPTINLRCGNIAGKNLTHGVIKDVCYRLIKEDQFYVYGNYPGSQKPYLHVDDIVELINLIISYPFQPDTYNIVGRNPISIDTLVNICMDTLKISKEIEWQPSKIWHGDNEIINASTNKASLLLSWEPSLSSEEVIKKTVTEEFLENITIGGCKFQIKDVL